MGKLKIHGGDWEGTSEFYGFEFKLPQKGKFWSFDKILATQLAEVEVATEEGVKRLGGTLGWGAVGAIALGPVGLLAGLLAGGRGTNVTFIARFKDGRKLLATTDAKTFAKIRAYVL